MNYQPEKVAYRPLEASTAYSIAKTKLYELINDGTLRTVKVGRARLILKSSLDALFATAEVA